jgi:polyisoprenoid-binding protein YceI
MTGLPSTVVPIATLLVLCSAFAPLRTETEYRLDPAQSSFHVRTGSTGLLRSFGHDHTIAIPEFAGTLRLTPGPITPAALDLTIEANSMVVVGDEKNRAKIERDLREAVLQTATYPQIRFQSTKIELLARSADSVKVRITGDLTLHGVTRPLGFEAMSAVTDERVRARGRFFVKHSDFGMKQFSVAGGTVKVKDQMELTFDIVALAAPSGAPRVPQSEP